MSDVPEMVERVARAIVAAYRNDDDSHEAMVRIDPVMTPI